MKNIWKSINQTSVVLFSSFLIHAIFLDYEWWKCLTLIITLFFSFMYLNNNSK